MLNPMRHIRWWTRGMRRLGGPQLPNEDIPPSVGWADHLNIDAIDYLHSESRKRLLEQRDEIEALKAKAPAIAGFATVVMIATGILGDLRISFTEDLIVSILFAVALSAFVCVLVGAGLVMRPRPMRTGVNPVWLSSYARDRASTARLQAATTEAQIDAFSRNRKVYERDRLVINGMMVSAAGETVAIVALIVVRAWSNAA